MGVHGDGARQGWGPTAAMRWEQMEARPDGGRGVDQMGAVTRWDTLR